MRIIDPPERGPAGYPITDLRVETVEGTWTGPTQWFERDRLEDHSATGQGVMAGRLGARLLELQGRPWQPGQEQQQPGYSLCRLFPETGYNACGPLRSYWENNGGLARFGYPITPAFQEQIESRTYLVQYFERRRMEYHPENQPPYDVLLGLLGREVLAREGGAGTPAIRYYWPATNVPPELSVMPEGSYATERMWVLQLAQPHAAEPEVTISGGVAGGAPGRKLQDVTVRGQRGTAFSSGASIAVLWSEQNTLYTVVGRRTLSELLSIAEGLEALDRASWERRLRPE